MSLWHIMIVHLTESRISSALLCKAEGDGGDINSDCCCRSRLAVLPGQPRTLLLRVLHLRGENQPGNPEAEAGAQGGARQGQTSSEPALN